jgi:hypothetical protein
VQGVHKLTVALGSSLALVACGAAPASAPAAPGSPAATSSASADATAPPPAAASANKAPEQRLQGTWEIVRYTSEHPIPDDAMPLMGDLFESLRLRFDGASFGARAGRRPEERVPFRLLPDAGGAFRLAAPGGLFDGARARFLDDDSWEVTDHGPTWPGVSVIKRVIR